MARSEGSLWRGRKAGHEVAVIPNAADLAAFARPVQDEMRKFVERVGGRMGLRTKTIPVGATKAPTGSSRRSPKTLYTDERAPRLRALLVLD